MNIKGNYVRLTKYNGGVTGSSVSWIIPYGDEFTVSTTQEYVQPIKKMFEELKNALVPGASAIAGSTAGIIAKLTMDMQDMLGIKLFNKDYYASAWIGSEPTTFSIKLNFFRGMKNNSTWSAYTEVYSYMQEIMKNTVPSYSNEDKGKVILTSAGPSSLEAFADFSTGIVDSLIKSGISLADPSGVDIKTIQSEINAKATTSIQKFIKGQTHTWDLEFGYSDGNTEILTHSYIKFPTLVMVQSSCSYSPQLAKSDKGYFPISGSIDLTFKTQSILTSTEFNELTKEE
jgi:hypothetical protein